jgi:hypothetical protein
MLGFFCAQARVHDKLVALALLFHSSPHIKLYRVCIAKIDDFHGSTGIRIGKFAVEWRRCRRQMLTQAKTRPPSELTEGPNVNFGLVSFSMKNDNAMSAR